jgi:hypothetical protein
MPKRRFVKFRSILLASISAVVAILGAVSSVLADSTGGPYP